MFVDLLFGSRDVFYKMVLEYLDLKDLLHLDRSVVNMEERASYLEMMASLPQVKDEFCFPYLQQYHKLLPLNSWVIDRNMARLIETISAETFQNLFNNVNIDIATHYWNILPRQLNPKFHVQFEGTEFIDISSFFKYFEYIEELTIEGYNNGHQNHSNHQKEETSEANSISFFPNLRLLRIAYSTIDEHFLDHFHNANHLETFEIFQVKFPNQIPRSFLQIFQAQIKTFTVSGLPEFVNSFYPSNTENIQKNVVEELSLRGIKFPCFHRLIQYSPNIQKLSFSYGMNIGLDQLFQCLDQNKIRLNQLTITANNFYATPCIETYSPDLVLEVEKLIIKVNINQELNNILQYFSTHKETVKFLEIDNHEPLTKDYSSILSMFGRLTHFEHKLRSMNPYPIHDVCWNDLFGEIEHVLVSQCIGITSFTTTKLFGRGEFS
jgi:hypothetical protein